MGSSAATASVTAFSLMFSSADRSLSFVTS